MGKNKKINILSSGRFHVCDLARELDRCGWDVKFYSYVPAFRSAQFGLPKKCSKSLLGIFFPWLILVKIFPKAGWINDLFTLVKDYITAFYMRKCDILIAMSGSYVHALQKAKRQGALVILERGSKHVLEQKKILESISSLKGMQPVQNITVKRELQGYELADYVTIASRHVEESFLLYGYNKKRLFVNPYGVDLSMFSPTIKQKDCQRYDVIMVGTWLYRKGVDILSEVCLIHMNISLLHVGGVGDCPLPVHPRFIHIDAVDQSTLRDYYSQAKIFVLPSREEGLSLVQAQALSCGLPIVCSAHTGGRDLRDFLDDKKWIIEMLTYTVGELVKCIQDALVLYNSMQDNQPRIYAAKECLDKLSWEAYGKRYSDFLEHSICKESE